MARGRRLVLKDCAWDTMIIEGIDQGCTSLTEYWGGATIKRVHLVRHATSRKGYQVETCPSDGLPLFIESTGQALRGWVTSNWGIVSGIPH
eukprot:1159755-Pelagomonas_calceolata.AAC.10